ncbi:MAG: arsenate reductase (glutaredoxin) [Pseudonocardia sp.]|nr:arsenate reductase (glutaredoxin) [Pseudonocardia sp.]
MDAVIWHNPSCSKSRGARQLLDDNGVDAREVRYLVDAPDRGALEEVLRKLGTDDPATITRTSEPRYRELGLAGADRDTLLDALAANPVLIERPIVIVGDRAVLARPPELLLELLDGST